ncbi:MAG: tyrosine-type recombinase/integrase [Acidimicrobiales bacterium]
MLPDETTVVDNTKAHSDRVQRMTDLVDDHLKAHEGRQKKARLATPAWEENGLVFCNAHRRPHRPLEPPPGHRSPCRDAGVDPISPNELRHSAPALLGNVGVPLEEVADFLGHANVRTLAQTYHTGSSAS